MAVSNHKQTRIQGINRGIILDAALEVFSTYGFRGSTIDQIADKAGMSKPNLLYYFPRKEDIYVTVLEKTLEDWLTPFREIDPNGDPIEELSKYTVIKLQMSASQPASSQLFANEVLHGAPAIQEFLKTRLKHLVDEKAAVIRDWIEQGRLAPVDPYHLIFMIWATTQHYADFNVQVRSIMPEETNRLDFFERTAESVLAILLNGIRPR